MMAAATNALVGQQHRARWACFASASHAWTLVLVLLACSLALSLLHPVGARGEPGPASPADSAGPLVSSSALTSSQVPYLALVAPAAPAASYVDADVAIAAQAAGSSTSTLHIPTSHTPPLHTPTHASAAPGGSVCELPEFAPGAPRPHISIYVFAWRRLTSLIRLLQSLAQAEYCGHRMPLTILVDGFALPSVVQHVKGFGWPHGPLTLLIQDEMAGDGPPASLGIRGMWINCSRPDVSDSEHVLPLEDDIEVSPLYYWWLLRAAAQYGPLGDGDLMRRRRLVGISLYTPRLNEIRYPQVKWLPDAHERAPAFLLQVPCSWGALFLGSQWREFLAFYRQRVTPPFFNFSQEATQRGVGKSREPLGDPHLRLPNSRSNVWPRSWKRFLIDFMYGRGLLMLYPNLRGQRSFSTTYMERGGHSAKDGREESSQALAVRKDIDPLKTVPLVAASQVRAAQHALADLPAFDSLAVFDLQHERRPAAALVHQGFAFTENVRWWGQARASRDATGRGAAAGGAAAVGVGPAPEVASDAATADRLKGTGEPNSAAAAAAAADSDGAAAAATAAAGAGASGHVAGGGGEVAGAGDDDWAHVYAQLADAWSGVFPASDNGLAGCALDSLPPLPPQPLDLETLLPGIVNLHHIRASRARAEQGEAHDARDRAAPTAADDVPGAATTAAATTAAATLTAAGSGPSSPGRYLVYQPPSGIGEWLVSLRNAAGVAVSLRRTLVVPHLLWGGSLGAPVLFSDVFELEGVRASLREAGRLAGYKAELMQVDEFNALGLAPQTLVLLHVKDPRLAPSRTYFDSLLGWRNVSATHMPAQMASSADYLRLYGGCGAPVLALSHLYAAFDGFSPGSPLASWWADALPDALVVADRAAVADKAGKMIAWLQRTVGRFSCVHLSDLDSAVLVSPLPLPNEAHGPGATRSPAAATTTPAPAVDVHAPASRSIPFPTPRASYALGSVRLPTTACDALDAEARHTMGRGWVREHQAAGFSCHVTESVIAFNLPRLPRGWPVFVLGDGGRSFSPALAKHAATLLQSTVVSMTELVSDVGLDLPPIEWPAVEIAICASASALMLNRYSPLSAHLHRKAAVTRASLADSPATQPPAAQPGPSPPPAAGLRGTSPPGAAVPPAGMPASPLWWTRQDTDLCLPLFTRTARFDIQANRFGILGQFGTERKLQLQTTNVSSLIGWDGKVTPNASIEFDVYVSNASHPLAIFEYTKENNVKGFTFSLPPPPGGWMAHTWHSFVLPITDRAYSFPLSTPWDAMNRLELYYANPSPHQPRGDYIRIRHVYLRSTSTHPPDTALGPSAAVPPRRSCRGLQPLVTTPASKARPLTEESPPAPAGFAHALPSGGDGAEVYPGAYPVSAVGGRAAGGDGWDATPDRWFFPPKSRDSAQPGASDVGDVVRSPSPAAPKGWEEGTLVMALCCASGAAVCAAAALLAFLGLQAQGPAGAPPSRLTMLGVELRQTLLWIGSGGGKKRQDLGL